MLLIKDELFDFYIDIFNERYPMENKLQPSLDRFYQLMRTEFSAVVAYEELRSLLEILEAECKIIT